MFGQLSPFRNFNRFKKTHSDRRSHLVIKITLNLSNHKPVRKINPILITLCLALGAQGLQGAAGRIGLIPWY